MPSPFPGMDPYLEAYWEDVHTSLNTYARDQLRTQLPKELRVRVEEHSETQRSVRIIDTSSANRLVTPIEFLSPTNKKDPSYRATFKQNQKDLLQGGGNLVEIGLIRGVSYTIRVPGRLLSRLRLAPYRINVIRGYRPNMLEVYPVTLRERLPRISIPLRESDSDAKLDLQELIEKSYENGDYAADFDYRLDPQPPLQGVDAAWADQLLREKGRR